MSCGNVDGEKEKKSLEILRVFYIENFNLKLNLVQKHITIFGLMLFQLDQSQLQLNFQPHNFDITLKAIVHRNRVEEENV